MSYREHNVTVTPEAADAIRRIAASHGMDISRTHLIITDGPRGRVMLDLSLDARERQDPANAVATSNDVTIVIPRKLAPQYQDLAVIVNNDAMRVRGAPPIELAAFNPAQVELAPAKLAKLTGELDEDAVARIAKHLRAGDSRAAIVASISPLVIAPYCRELDAVALLRFDDALAEKYGIRKPGGRMLAVNSFEFGDDVVSDLVRGEGCTERYRNFVPLIAEFISNDAKRIVSRKKEILAEEWSRAAALTQTAIETADGRYRDGRPQNAGTPAP